MNLFRIGVLAVAMTALGAAASYASEPQRQFCFTQDTPPRVHGNYERSQLWEWDNRRIS